MKILSAAVLAAFLPAACACGADSYFTLPDDAEVFAASHEVATIDPELIELVCSRCCDCGCQGDKAWSLFGTQTADYGTNLALPIGLTPANTLVGPVGDPGAANILTSSQAALLGLLGNLGLAPVAPGPAPEAFFPDDFQFQTTAGFQYQKAIGDYGTLQAGYSYYQNLHPTVEQLDLQSHTPTVQYSQQLTDRLVAKTYYTYSYYFLSGSSYVNQNRTGTGLTFTANERWTWATRFDYNYANFQPAPFLNSHNYAGVLEATRYFRGGTDTYLTFGYGSGYSDARLRGFAYQINNVYTTFRTLFGRCKKNELRLTGSYGHYNFFDVDPLEGVVRDDRIFTSSIFYGRQLTDNLQLFASYTFLDSDSTVIRQEYDSSLTSIGGSFTY